MLIACQPVGIFTGAAAHLLLPSFGSFRTQTASENTALLEVEGQTLAQLLLGNLAVEVPDDWQFYLAAAKGDIAVSRQLLWSAYRQLDDAASKLDSLQADNRSLPGEWFTYNSLVLEPSQQNWQRAQTVLTVPPLKSLAQVVAYAYGLSDDLPVIDGLQGELRAWSLSALVSKQVEQENYLAARQTLVDAIESARPHSPLLGAILFSQSAQLAERCQVPGELVEQELQQAIELSRGCALSGLVAELYTQLGMVRQRCAGEERFKLLAAIQAYQQALQSGITGASHAELFAEVHNNLGLCYLSMPQTESSAQLRTGIAIQSFRYGLESIDRETHGELWARINMNLANALQYAPSSHPAENLVQAVEIYEQVLQVRSRARDPVAYALTILNQANGLAHLGMFKPALEKASEAYKLFQWYDQGEAATAARELVENINTQLVARSPGSNKMQATADGPSDSSEVAIEPQEQEHGPVPATAV